MNAEGLTLSITAVDISRFSYMLAAIADENVVPKGSCFECLKDSQQARLPLAGPSASSNRGQLSMSLGT